MPFNTRNPIPSGDLRDLDDNARNIDTWANDKTKLSHPDRLGVERYTWHGIEQKAQLDIAAGVADATADAEQARDQAIDAKNAAQEAAMMSGFSKYADTLAQLEAGIGTDYVDGDVVMVFQDESRGDTSSIFKIESGAAEFKLTFDKTRQDLLSFSGNISADAEWSDVPAHSDPAFDAQAQALADRVEWLKEHSATIFASRAEFVTTVAKGFSVDEGKDVIACGLRYKSVSGSAEILDLPGYEPAGFASPDHYGDARTGDAAPYIRKAMFYAANHNIPCQLEGEYPASPRLWIDNIAGKNLIIKTPSTATVNIVDDETTKTWPVLDIKGLELGETGITASVFAGSNSINLIDSELASVDYDYRLTYSRLVEGDHRFNDGMDNRYAQHVTPTRVESDGTIYLKDNLLWDFENKIIASGTAMAGTATTIQLAAGSLVSDDVVRFKIRLTDGTGAGQERWVAAFDETTQTVSLVDEFYTGYSQPQFSPIPDATTKYEIVSEVTVTVAHPAKRVDIGKNIAFQRTHRSGSISSGVRVMYVRYLDVSCKVSGCSDWAVRPTFFYHARVKNAVLSGANYAIANGGGRGYAVQFNRGYLGEIYDSTAYNCRSAFDAVNGVAIVRRSRNFVFGGGKTFDGQDFFPQSLSRTNKGLISHAGAGKVIDTDNTIIDCHASSNVSYASYINLGNRHLGSCYELWRLMYCKDVLIDGFVYDSGSPMPSNDTSSYNPGQTAKYIPSCGGQLYHATMQKRARIRIKNLQSKLMNGPLVRVTSFSTTFPADYSIELIGNKAGILINSSYQKAESIVIDHPSITLAKLTDVIDIDNEFVVYDPEGIQLEHERVDRLNIFRRLKLSNGNKYQLDRYRILKIQNNEAVSIPAYGASSGVVLSPSKIDVLLTGTGGATTQDFFTGFFASTGWLHNSHGTLFSDPATSLLSGATGSTGKVNISLTEGRLYIENRTGTWRLIMVSVN